MGERVCERESERLKKKREKWRKNEAKWKRERQFEQGMRKIIEKTRF